MNNDFPRIKRLPPYVFNITNELKMAARHRGEDIIDLSMGNPDGDTPKHIVDKMVEVAQRPGTHGYSASRGIPRLRKAISDWYKRRWDVDIDPDKEAIVTIGSKGRYRSPDARNLRPRRHGPRSESELPDSYLRFHHRRCRRPQRPHGPRHRFLQRIRKSRDGNDPQTQTHDSGFPEQPDRSVCRSRLFEKLVALAKKHGVYIVHDLAYADIVYDGFKAPSIMQVRALKTWPSSSLR